MRHGYKGFTLVELMVTIAVLAILVTIGIPSFVGLINNTKADTESTDLYRALNYARLEAINRGASIRITPSVANDWTSRLDIQVVNAGVVTNPVLRVIADMSASAVVTPKDIANIEYNNLGALANPVTAVAFSYTQGTYTKAIGVCLNGRVILGGTCP